mgnify:CR=1 FL=1
MAAWADHAGPRADPFGHAHDIAATEANVLGLLSLVLGTVEHARDLRSLRVLHPDMPRSLSGLVAIVMASLGLAALVAVALNA